ncbi:hypothetical protein [Methylobacterium nonmethylotrophicum]|uniref:Uncharacterized protein n=1 Tax=Methylobacterium nonmethylotrophicum TaxID=1141884 RepID=A0A4Z0NPV6_9HYPH|nr:hypothetical protein [Methylobacterium nonmethylotrophicum]TGD98029.1 hypothetical protein EU555_17935 [Methylobacterium nonmethylotrophicum]
MDGGHGRRASADVVRCVGGATATRGGQLALRRVRAACRLCGFSIRGFLNGTTCVLQVEGRALRAACREAGTPGACGVARACAGLQEAVRAARRP